jgi:hypothetical protein
MLSKIFDAFVSGTVAVTLIYMFAVLFPAFLPSYGDRILFLGSAFLAGLVVPFCVQSVSKNKAGQYLLVHVDVPRGTDLSALMLILDDTDRIILGALLKHGRLDQKKSAVKYDGPHIYSYVPGEFEIHDKTYRPHLLRVVSPD